MPSINLTQIAVERLKPIPTGRVDYRDKKLPGFGIRVSGTEEKPVKTWTVVYRRRGQKKLERYTIGSFAQIDKVDMARDMARDILQRVAKGEDPKAISVAEEIRTVASVIPTFIERYLKAKGRAGSYITNTQRTFEKDIIPKLGKRDIKSITRGDIIDLLDAVVDDGRPVQANRVLAAVRKLFNWSLDRGYIDSSPVVRMSAPSAESDRERVLEPDELRLVWLAAGKIGYPYGPIVQLLILTLQRRNEVAHAPWPEFGNLDDALWALPGSRTKNGQPNDVPLSDTAVEILKALPRAVPKRVAGKKIEDWLFVGERGEAVTGFANAKARIDENILEIQQREAKERGEDPSKVEPIPHWTLHDLRRTGSTRMSEDLEIAPHVVEAIINHVSGTIKGVARTYNRAKFAKPKRQALDAWAAYVEALIGPTTDSNVIQMRGAK